MFSASIQSKAKRVFADDFGEIVGELDVPRNGCSNPVLPDGGYGAVGEIEVREGIGGGMRGDAYRMVEDQPELRDGRCPLDGESVIFVVIGESKAEFVQQRRSDRIVVGNYQAAISFVSSVAR